MLYEAEKVDEREENRIFTSECLLYISISFLMNDNNNHNVHK